MGQYYKATILKKNWKLAKKQPVAASLLCYDFNNGAKLMEHSYAGNQYVAAVLSLLGTAYKGYPFVWVGDYADEVKTFRGVFDIYTQAGRFIYKDYDGTQDGHSKRYEGLKKFVKDGNSDYKYLLNYTKKEFCIIPSYNPDEWTIHPLPLLTCSGNGRGGGDYRLVEDGYNYEEDERIGSWAYCKIGATNDINETIGFKHIDGKFRLDF